MNKMQQYKAAEALANALRDELIDGCSLEELIENGFKVEAIKKYRADHGGSLMEAKFCVDSIEEDMKKPQSVTPLGDLMRRKLAEG